MLKLTDLTHALVFLGLNVFIYVSFQNRLKNILMPRLVRGGPTLMTNQVTNQNRYMTNLKSSMHDQLIITRVSRS